MEGYGIVPRYNEHLINGIVPRYEKHLIIVNSYYDDNYYLAKRATFNRVLGSILSRENQPSK